MGYSLSRELKMCMHWSIGGDRAHVYGTRHGGPPYFCPDCETVCASGALKMKHMQIARTPSWRLP
jgi:hypothetical protein